MQNIHECLFDSRFQFDREKTAIAKAEGKITLYAMTARASDWIKGMYAGQPIRATLRTVEARQAQAEIVEQWVSQIAGIVGNNDWNKIYHDQIWSRVSN